MSKTTTVTLENPITRGANTITTIALRRPNVETLKGLALADVLSMDVQTLVTLLPRISTPSLTQHEVKEMDPADLMALGQEVTYFLLPKRTVDQVKAEIGDDQTAPSTSTSSNKLAPASA
ncbi:phage tail assembly protein [Crenobacter sp. SG2305]|uniref:phage tail assembly protein n=1 Tax=Crenobacter oryzisoli TaxID=3056844 RepID=UPI0025AA4FBC|nr:phage tail assembly protein [Crenobacter sp. SG2305]MDN0081621.1 phage tail assembly protein [Crenobacter sp. SG2305]